MKTVKYYNLLEGYSMLNTNYLCTECGDLTVWEQDEAFRLYKKLKDDKTRSGMTKSGYRSHFRSSTQMRAFVGKLEQMSGDFDFEDWCCDGGGVLIKHKKFGF